MEKITKKIINDWPWLMRDTILHIILMRIDYDGEKLPKFTTKEKVDLIYKFTKYVQDEVMDEEVINVFEDLGVH